MTKNEYLDYCKRVTNELEEGLDVIYEFDRNKNGRRQGVVIAFINPQNNNVYVGWSRCHDKKDNFNRDIALVKAFDRSIELSSVKTYLLGEELIRESLGVHPASDVPHSIRKLVRKMVNRAERYFQQASLTTEEEKTKDAAVGDS